MITFDTNHIITGQIKEILSSFNLPKFRVYTKENKDYHDYAVAYNETVSKSLQIPEEINIVPTVKRKIDSNVYPETLQYAPYIKNGIIQYYVENNNKWVWENSDYTFSYDLYIKNWTKTLKINNNIYDYYTHEYLGDYLRFYRDYYNINLMPLYNCFSNRLCNKLNYKWSKTINKNSNEEESTTTVSYSFTTNDKNYKIYMFPVKLFKKYTIAIDCEAAVEICCGIYGKYQNEETKLAFIQKDTYKKYNKMTFGKPECYDLINNISSEATKSGVSDLAKNEQDLKMFIKLPVNNNSTIVVLEGDYRNYNDSFLKYQEKTANENKNKKLVRTQNYTETNFDLTAQTNIVEKEGKIIYSKTQDFSNFKPVTALQLLRANTKQQHPFADRLIEYLTDNVITSQEEILDNVRRVQKVITLNAQHKDGKSILKEDLLPKTEGVWEDSIRAIVYDKFNKTVAANNNDTNHDILGYVDKDIESQYRANTGKKDEKGKDIYNTISGIDLYTTAKGKYSDLGEDDK